LKISSESYREKFIVAQESPCGGGDFWIFGKGRKGKPLGGLKIVWPGALYAVGFWWGFELEWLVGFCLG